MRRTLASRVAWGVILAFASLAWCNAAEAKQVSSTVLFERSLTVDRSSNIFKTDQFDLAMVLGNSFFSPTNGVTLFGGSKVTPADVGRVFEATAASEPNFPTAVQRLTDSLNEYVRLDLTERASGRAEKRGWQERGFFTGIATADSPDLAGSLITALRLRVDGFTLIPAGAGATLAAAGPPMNLSLTFSVMGVPEPTALGLGPAGLAAFAARGRIGRGKRNR